MKVFTETDYCSVLSSVLCSTGLGVETQKREDSMLPADSSSLNKLRTVLHPSQVELLILTFRNRPPASFPSLGMAVLCLWRLKCVEQDRFCSVVLSVIAVYGSHDTHFLCAGIALSPCAGGTSAQPRRHPGHRGNICVR